MSSHSLVRSGLRDRVRGMAEPIARGLGRLGLTPNHLTLIGFGIAILAAIAAATQNWLVAGLLVLFGGVFDLFDGALARATGRVSKLGAFYDSVFDRWGESAIYLGVIVGSLGAGFWMGAVLGAAAMGSAFMVSYTRAKSEGLGFTEGTGMAAVGLAPREVRIVLLVIGLIATDLLGGLRIVYDPFFGTGFGGFAWFDENDGSRVLAVALGLIAVLATITTIQRILHVRKQAAEDRA